MIIFLSQSNNCAGKTTATLLIFNYRNMGRQRHMEPRHTPKMMMIIWDCSQVNFLLVTDCILTRPLMFKCVCWWRVLGEISLGHHVKG